MTFPSPSHSAHSSIASGAEKSSASRPARPQHSAWGSAASQPSSSTRRGLTPLATNNLSSSSTSGSPSRRPTQSHSPAPSAPAVSVSPLTSTFSAILSSTTRHPNRNNNPSPASTPASFSSLQTGGQQQQQQHSTGHPLTSPKSRALTPSSVSHLATSTASTSGGGGSGGGGGGGLGGSGGAGVSRGATFSPSPMARAVGSPTGSHSDKPNSGSASSSGLHSGQSSLSKISVAQVFLLLDSITEKEGKEKWETKAAQIQKLVESNGMDVFPKYFRRLLTGNSPQIFPGINKVVENAGNYPLLVQEMTKVSQDLDQARKIAETIDASEGDIFRDFDLATFLYHFQLDPLVKTALALAFTDVSKPDLRAKVLSNSAAQCLQSLSSISDTNKDFPTEFIATTIERLIFTRGSDEELKKQTVYAARMRYQTANMDIPPEVNASLQTTSLSDPRLTLVRRIQSTGPASCNTRDALVETLSAVGPDAYNEEQIAAALLFMILSQNSQQFSPELLVAAVLNHQMTSQFSWQAVVKHFDREDLAIDATQFTRLFNLLLPIAQQDSSFDIQLLWGGEWLNRDTQFSFLTAFLSSGIDTTNIPNYREAFPASIFDDASDAVKQQAEQTRHNGLRSLDAVNAIFNLVLLSPGTWAVPEGQAFVKTILQHDLPTFLCSAFAVPQPWTTVQHNFIIRSFMLFITKRQDGYEFALHGVWKIDRQWVAEQLFHAFTQDPSCTGLIYEHAVEHGWLQDLLDFTNGLGMDLASLANRKDNFDIEQWIKNAAQKTPIDMGGLIAKFLRIKGEDELRVQRKEQDGPQMVPLAVKTVHTMLMLLDEYPVDNELLVSVQRLCLQTYPRLINYGAGFDDIIDANGAQGNAIPEAVDKQMQDLFGKMYHEELSLREILELMRRYRSSREPAEQDLFTCMVHGLIDEYHCYHEYPLEALTKTAVMFGGIINFGLISGIPLKVGLGMILDAVKDHQRHESMFKFGVEAIEQLIQRLSEWPAFCAVLVQIPSLQGTPVYKKAHDVLREQGHPAVKQNEEDETNGLSDSLALANGNIDDLVGSDGMTRNFQSLHVDPPLRPDVYHRPDEDVQDKVLFALNNVSEQNIKEKLKDLQEVLRDEHHQWFASYLVEERAKFQPNFQQLYLDLLDLIDDKLLWAEILRETYVTAIRLLNAESTLTSTTERSHLKNIGCWLGSLTIAKDKPIKHKNIYFKDLLIEAFDSQRLIVVIPFTCKVLAQAMKSTIFKPPNPWLMDILSLLMEIYHFTELKMILKFEIEVLCSDLQVDHKSIEPSTCIRERPAQLDEAVPQTALPEGLGAFDDMTLAGLHQTVRNERVSPAAVISSLPNLEQILVFPPSASSMVDPNILKQIVLSAVERAIAEIIAPVVERSITIASISTGQLIVKDFAMEPDEEKMRQAAATMVRSLAGSLALVTCKEPLKMSMTNYIRMIQQEYSDQPMPEGLILMCVNDNLDAACGIVEKAAEEKSVPEIEKVIEQQIEARRHHRAARTNDPFFDSNISRWGFFIPEPYRLAPGGLNKEQLAIYEDFVRQSRGSGAAHIQQASTDSGKQISDALQEPFPAIPNLSTPAEQPAVPHQITQQQQQQQQQQPQQQQDGAMQPPATAGTQPQINGFLETANPREKVDSFITELQQASRNATEEHVKDLSRETQIFQTYNQILRTILASPNGEELARITSVKICNVLYSQAEKNLEVEVLVHLLSKLCELSNVIAREICVLLADVEDGQVLNSPVTLALVDAGLMDLQRVDTTLAKMIRDKHVAALELLSTVMDRLLLNDEPSALRSDFSASLGALSQWIGEVPDLASGKEIIRKLRESGIPEVISPLLTDHLQSKRDQVEYIFSEWLTLYKNPATSDQTYSLFLKDMHQRQVINNQDDSTFFFRLLVDLSVATSEHEYQNATGGEDEIFLHIDALAKMVVLLVKFQGETNGSVKSTKAEYLNSILSLLVLVLNHHQVMRGESFNQRAFFRLFSSVLCEYGASGLQETEEHKDMMLVFSDKFLSLQPKRVPGFVYSWLSLISHRAFMAVMLTLPEQEGWAPFCEIMQVMLSYIGEQLKPANVPLVAKDLYKGALRILLILHHDFPEFVAENHFQFCNVIPAHCTQLRNLVLSAYPSSFQKLPDPFRDGLKVDRLDEIRQAPKIVGDIVAPLQHANVKATVDNALRNVSATDKAAQQVLDAVYNPSSRETGLFLNPIDVDFVVLHALVLYVGQSAVSSAVQKNGAMAFNNTPQLALLEKLAKSLRPEARYYFLSAIANQLRYPNSHTHYFSYVILHLFGTEESDQQGTDIREQIIRVLLERLIVHRPHPWGLIITLQELLQNGSYTFFRLPFIQAAPEICRLFDALLQHIQQQSPRPLT